MSTVNVCVRFDWAAHGTVTLDDRGHLIVATLPAVPGIYRWTLTDRPGQARPEVYVGEGVSLARRIGDYRRPSKLATAGRLHRVFVEHLSGGGRLMLEIATVVEIVTAGGEVALLPLARRTARHLAEHAAVALAYVDGAVAVLNADTPADGQ